MKDELATLLKCICAALLAIGLLTPARIPAAEVTIDVHADQVVGRVSRLLTGACIEDVNHEIYGGLYSQMIFGESFLERPSKASATSYGDAVSGMWQAVRRPAPEGKLELVADAFDGHQVQQITGGGEIGLVNRSLNHWGMNFVANRRYEGYVWARSDRPSWLSAALEHRAGLRAYDKTLLRLTGNDWQRIDFTLTPKVDDPNGQFTLLKGPGSVSIGHVFLQPGAWGRFKDLPVRRDVAEAMIDEGITVLRYGGSMVNAEGYRWKKMIGPRDRRPPYTGTWYKNSSNGWGILDFMDFCEAAGFAYVPDFNVNESPQDMADFIEYATGAAESAWGKKCVAAGHPEPYKLKYIELGNEERVDDNYAAKFEALATAIWAKNPNVILVVGDFQYENKITDPLHITGADSRITSLAGQQRILKFAKQHDGEVWFDVHVWTEGPGRTGSLDALPSYIDAIDKLADGAKHRVVVFELNANNHDIRRALGNALAINAIERDGRLPICCSANGLQPDGQNDNGWDQGLLFFNPSRTWLQPPGYVTQMISRNYLPQAVKCAVQGGGPLDVVARRSEDGKTLALQVVNATDQAAAADIHLNGFTPQKPAAKVTELSGPMNAVNTADQPNAVTPKSIDWQFKLSAGAASYTFPPRSLTIIRLE
jgi:hypothetical protein